jgi:hypothetical protein
VHLSLWQIWGESLQELLLLLQLALPAKKVTKVCHIRCMIFKRISTPNSRTGVFSIACFMKQFSINIQYSILSVSLDDAGQDYFHLIGAIFKNYVMTKLDCFVTRLPLLPDVFYITDPASSPRALHKFLNCPISDAEV